MSKKKQATNTQKTLTRSICSCQATVHPLINNCTSCGKIICERENEGPCFFCGNLVFRRQKLGEKKQKEHLFNNDENAEDPEFQRAEELKNRLLQYDASQIADSNIIDEQTDWYEMSEDVWTSKQNKEYATKKIVEENIQKEEINAGTFIAFDATTKTFIEEKKTFDYDKSKKEIQQFRIDSQIKERQQLEKKLSKQQEKLLLDPLELQGDMKLKSESRGILEEIRKDFGEKYKEHIEKKEKYKSEDYRKKMQEKVDALRFSFNRDENYETFLSLMEEILPDEESEDLYDQEIFPESTDKGKCLSMLQPWASLLIEGFKRFEGRFWSTEYRGPLWIQAGSTAPAPETVKTVEAEYEEFYKRIGEKRPEFPNRYPLGSLLGLVDLQTVLTKDKYYERIPEEFREKSFSENIFVIRNPRKLKYPIKFPGSKDIFEIPEEIRKSAFKCLKKVKTNWWPYYAQNLTIQETIAEENEETVENEEETNIIEKKPEEKAKEEQIWEKPIKKTFNGKKFQKRNEKFGFSISEFFDEDNLSEIRSYLDEKALDKKNYYSKNIFLINYDHCFPYFEQINELFAGLKIVLKLKNMKCKYFHLAKKQKPFEIEDKIKVLLNIGSNISLTLTNEDLCDISQVVLIGGAFFIIPEKTKVSFQNIIDSNEKKKNQKGAYINLLISLYEN